VLYITNSIPDCCYYDKAIVYFADSYIRQDLSQGVTMASIIVTSGEQKGEYLPLGRRTNVIGRAEALPMQILDDKVSRKHLRILYDENTNEHSAEDMNSKHGVIINDRKITDITKLTEGDRIRIGQTTLIYTEKDFDDRESALSHFKKIGERQRPTMIE
jgi:pSer/pThr/pTyr-binding forkhead associated (FHA) protein